MASPFLRFSRSHTTTHHSRQDSSGRVISLSQRPLPDNTQHSKQTNIHAPRGIRNHDLSRRAAKDLRLRPRGHWDRPLGSILESVCEICENFEETFFVFRWIAEYLGIPLSETIRVPYFSFISVSEVT